MTPPSIRPRRPSRDRAAIASAARAALAALPIVLAACRARPTAPAPTAPAADVAASEAPSGVPSTAAPIAQASAAPPSAVPRTIAPPTAAPPTGAPPTAVGALPPAADLLGRRLTGGVLGAAYHLAAIRTGEHDGFTRVVWEMDEAAGAPRWTALLRRDVEGTAVIDVTLADIVAVEKPGAMAAQAVQSPVVDSVQPRRMADDAVVAFAIRLARPAGYAVTLLEAPVRVVVDVAHAP